MQPWYVNCSYKSIKDKDSNRKKNGPRTHKDHAQENIIGSTHIKFSLTSSGLSVI